MTPVSGGACAHAPGATHATGPTGTAQEPTSTAIATDSACSAACADSPGTTGTTVAEQQRGPAGAAVRPHTTDAAGAAIAEQAGRPARPTGLTRRCTGTPVAAVSPQQATSSAGVPWGTVGAVANKRTAQQCIGRRINHAQDALFERLQGRCGGGLSA